MNNSVNRQHHRLFLRPMGHATSFPSLKSDATKKHHSNEEHSSQRSQRSADVGGVSDHADDDRHSQHPNADGAIVKGENGGEFVSAEEILNDETA